MERESFTLRLPKLHILFRLEKPGDFWEVHCLDYGVMTSGRTFLHAQYMLGEALAMTLLADLSMGLDLSGRRSPQEYWDEFDQVRRIGKPARIDLADPAMDGKPCRLAMIGSAVFVAVPNSKALDGSPDELRAPPPIDYYTPAYMQA